METLKATLFIQRTEPQHYLEEIGDTYLKPYRWMFGGREVSLLHDEYTIAERQSTQKVVLLLTCGIGALVFLPKSIKGFNWKTFTILFLFAGPACKLSCLIFPEYRNFASKPPLDKLLKVPSLTEGKGPMSPQKIQHVLRARLNQSKTFFNILLSSDEVWEKREELYSYLKSATKQGVSFTIYIVDAKVNSTAAKRNFFIEAVEGKASLILGEAPIDDNKYDAVFLHHSISHRHRYPKPYSITFEMKGDGKFYPYTPQSPPTSG